MEDVMNGIPGIGKMMEMMQKLENTNTQEDAEALKLEMDTFLQTELGVDVEKLNEQLESTTKQFQNQNN
jgi:imidazoleglycerol phosphate synthase glutamine amidotransferase subunit HisH